MTHTYMIYNDGGIEKYKGKIEKISFLSTTAMNPLNDSKMFPYNLQAYFQLLYSLISIILHEIYQTMGKDIYRDKMASGKN